MADTKYVKKAFTIAEILIAMSVLSIITTFNINKGIIIYHKQMRAALVKETYSTISALLWEGTQSGEIFRSYNNWSSSPPIAYFANKMGNVALVCGSSGVPGVNVAIPVTTDTAKCWAGGTGNSDKMALRLTNGVSIYMDQQYGYFSLRIDYNGPDKGPNQSWMPVYEGLLSDETDIIRFGSSNFGPTAIYSWDGFRTAPGCTQWSTIIYL